MEPTSARDLLVSIRPRFAWAVIAGLKRVELRRVRPAVDVGGTIVFYATSPVCAVVAVARVAQVIEGPPSRLWKRVGAQTGLARQEFRDYFRGRPTAYAIRFDGLAVRERPVTLAELRRAVPDFAPPQSYWYLREDRARDRTLSSCW